MCLNQHIAQEAYLVTNRTSYNAVRLRTGNSIRASYLGTTALTLRRNPDWIEGYKACKGKVETGSTAAITSTSDYAGGINLAEMFPIHDPSEGRKALRSIKTLMSPTPLQYQKQLLAPSRDG